MNGQTINIAYKVFAKNYLSDTLGDLYHVTGLVVLGWGGVHEAGVEEQTGHT